MRFKLHTLVDITETKARRGDDYTLVRQQQNFLTVLQTIGLRVNPSYNTSPIVVEAVPKSFNLGTEYKGKHRVWTFVFEIEYQDGTDIETMISDFEYVPIISGLDETAKFTNDSFITCDLAINNIYFEQDDK